PEEVFELAPTLRGATLAGGLFTPGCGVTDIHALLGTFAERARAGGATTSLKTPLTGIRVEGGRVVGAETPRGTIATEQVVDAAGFAANGVAALAGLGPLPMVPVRRHLFVTAPWNGVRRDAPFVWDVSQGYYYRPEGEGLLLCACDETPWPPEDPPADPGAREALAAKFDAAVPGLHEVRPTRGWAGLRVMTPDHRFIIGPDPRLTGFFWVAGLGGHGMTTSAGVGEIAARGLVEGAVPAPFGDVFAPGRFLA
ncbi:MAG: FAD-binding oxidoreductase, partial [Deltaproteobacteria bacterium]